MVKIKIEKKDIMYHCNTYNYSNDNNSNGENRNI